VGKLAMIGVTEQKSQHRLQLCAPLDP